MEASMESNIFSGLFDENGDCICREGKDIPIVMDFKENVFNQIWTEELDLGFLAKYHLGKFLDEHPEFKYSCDAVQLYYTYNEDDPYDYDVIKSFFKFSPKKNKNKNVEGQ